MGTALVFEDVSVRYGGVAALSNVAFAVEAGQFCGLIGPNGAGKSTLLNVTSGFVAPTAGRVLVAGREISRRPPHRVARLGVGRTFQHVALIDGCSVRDNVRVGPRQVAADAVIAALGLSEVAEVAAAALDQGQRRRVELARALAARPQLLLLDEPLSGLGSDEAQAIATLIAGVVTDTGATCLVVEHNVALLRSLVTRLIVMDRGRVIADGRPDAVLADDDVSTAYLGAGAAA